MMGLPRDLVRVVVSFVACGSTEVISQKLKDDTAVRKMFDVRNAKTLSRDICGYQLSIHLHRKDITCPWMLMLFWSVEDPETEELTYTAKFECMLMNGIVPPLIELAPRSIVEMPRIIVRAFDDSSQGPMISAYFF